MMSSCMLLAFAALCIGHGSAVDSIFSVPVPDISAHVMQSSSVCKDLPLPLHSARTHMVRANLGNVRAMADLLKDPSKPRTVVFSEEA